MLGPRVAILGRVNVCFGVKSIGSLVRLARLLHTYQRKFDGPSLRRRRPR
jgi:hypothetical protein